MKPIEVFTDGACSGNPGKGGFGVIIKTPTGTGFISYEHSAGYAYTTNNRMELLAVIYALEHIKENSDVVITTDSTYVVNAINKNWLNGWQKNHWKASGGKAVKNQDLWLRYLEASKNKQVKFIWVRGHQGHPENERCDALAVKAYGDSKSKLLKDTEYLKENNLWTK